MFRRFRIGFLLLILISTALGAYRIEAKHANWSNTKWVVIYPLNGDGSVAAANYIERLKEYKFESISDFFAEESKKYNLSNSEPIKILLGPVINENPPPPPSQSKFLEIAWWSLKVRYWASGIKDNYDGPPADINIFIKYYDPAQNSMLPHSHAVAKLSLGIVNAFAAVREEQRNNVVIAHELLHVFNASDKYDLHTTLPLFPEGYAEPQLVPLYPQNIAEIMGGRIPISTSQADMPPNLRHAIVGEKTAAEINWKQGS